MIYCKWKRRQNEERNWNDLNKLKSTPPHTARISSSIYHTVYVQSQEKKLHWIFMDHKLVEYIDQINLYCVQRCQESDVGERKREKIRSINTKNGINNLCSESESSAATTSFHSVVHLRFSWMTRSLAHTNTCATQIDYFIFECVLDSIARSLLSFAYSSLVRTERSTHV